MPVVIEFEYPTSFEELDWDNINPLNINYWNAIQGAIDERYKVCIAFGDVNTKNCATEDKFAYDMCNSDTVYSNTITKYRTLLNVMIPTFVNHTINNGDFTGELYWDDTFYFYGYQYEGRNFIPCWTIYKLMEYLGYTDYLRLEEDTVITDPLYILALKQIYEILCQLKWISGIYDVGGYSGVGPGFLYESIFPIAGRLRNKTVQKSFYRDSEEYLKPPQQGFAEIIDEFDITPYSISGSYSNIGCSVDERFFYSDDTLYSYIYILYSTYYVLRITQPFSPILYNSLDIYMIPTFYFPNPYYVYNSGSLDKEKNKLFKYKTVNFIDDTDIETNVPEEIDVYPKNLENGLYIGTPEANTHFIGYRPGFNNQEVVEQDPENPLVRLRYYITSHPFFFVFKFDGPNGFKFRGTDW